MKKLFMILTAVQFSLPALADDAREIKMHTEKVEGHVHWEPARVEVHTGEKVKFVLENNLAGQPSFHGFKLDALKITKQVNQGKPVTVQAEIPNDLAPGEYDIKCHFHEKHIGSKLVVSNAASRSASAIQGQPMHPGAAHPKK